jgi:hypothetical protein
MENIMMLEEAAKLPENEATNNLAVGTKRQYPCDKTVEKNGAS